MTRMVSMSASCACKNKILFPYSRMSEPLKKVGLDMWFDGENESSTRLIQTVSTISLQKKSSKVSYKILLLSDSTFFKLFFHILATTIQALIIAGHKFLYTLLIECGRLRC